MTDKEFAKLSNEEKEKFIIDEIMSLNDDIHCPEQLFLKNKEPDIDLDGLLTIEQIEELILEFDGVWDDIECINNTGNNTIAGVKFDIF